METGKDVVRELVVVTFEEVTGVTLSDPVHTYCEHQQECDAINQTVQDQLGVKVHFDTDMTLEEFIDEASFRFESYAIR
jgi:hypothetical protein